MEGAQRREVHKGEGSKAVKEEWRVGDKGSKRKLGMRTGKSQKLTMTDIV